MKKMERYVVTLLLLATTNIFAQTDSSKIVVFDKTVYDFGIVNTSCEKLKCTYTLTNVSDKPIYILRVVPSCGCTTVEWTREPISQNGTGNICAYYSNDEEGEHPFNKGLRVFISDTDNIIDKPVVLRFRGEFKDKTDAVVN